MSSIMSKPFNPSRLVRFHNNTKHPIHKTNREWQATTSIDVLSLDELRERLNELIEKHHAETRQLYSLTEPKEPWTIQTISIVWNMPFGTEGLQNLRTPLYDGNFKKFWEKMVLRNAGDLIRVQYESKREVKKKVVDYATFADCVMMERYR